MKTSFYKLLWMIEKKIAPKKVKYDDMIFEWSNVNYRYRGNDAKLHFLSDYFSMEDMLKDEIEILDDEDEEKGLPEKIDVIAYEKCVHEVTDKEKQLALEIRETQIALNEVLDYLKSKGE